MQISVETLKETAHEFWAKGVGIRTQLWSHYVKAGLYEWAAQKQAEYNITEYVPAKESLIAPSSETFVLAPLPTPPAMPAKPQGPISKRTRNRGQRAMQSVRARHDFEQNIAYSPHDFVQFALPHKKMEENVYVRQNGRLSVTLTTRGGFPIPFGQDRLFPLWLATAFQAAGQPADNTIRFRSASDILAAFQQSPDGDSRRILRDRIQRWHHTTIDIDMSDSEAIHQASYSLIEEAHLWFHRGVNSQLSLWQNVIKLHSRFADSLRKNVIPIDFETVVALRDMPGALDLYIWQAHRSYEMHLAGQGRPTAVKLESLLLQLGTRSPFRKAKQLLKQWQGVIKEVWPDCPNYLDGGRNLFMIHAGQAVFKRSTAKLPGVLPVPPVPLRPLQLNAGEDALVLKPVR